MIIDVRKLKFSGKFESDFAFEYNKQGDLPEFYGIVLDGPVSVSGTSILQGDDVYIDGTVRCKIVGECARCLKKVEREWSCDFSVVYAITRQDEDDYLYQNGRVDLTPAVEDVILTSLPTVIYCKDDCLGLCPECGKDLNEGPCGCKK